MLETFAVDGLHYCCFLYFYHHHLHMYFMKKKGSAKFNATFRVSTYKFGKFNKAEKKEKEMFCVYMITISHIGTWGDHLLDNLLTLQT